MIESLSIQQARKLVLLLFQKNLNPSCGLMIVVALFYTRLPLEGLKKQYKNQLMA